MSDKIFDGATVSLNRQLDMIRHIFRNNKKGLKFDDIQFHMLVRHGVSEAWVLKFLKLWSKFGVVKQKGIRFIVDDDKLKLVWEARDQGFDVYGPTE